jgi:hypothetical protein
MVIHTYHKAQKSLILRIIVISSQLQNANTLKLTISRVWEFQDKNLSDTKVECIMFTLHDKQINMHV